MRYCLREDNVHFIYHNVECTIFQLISCGISKICMELNVLLNVLILQYVIEE